MPRVISLCLCTFGTALWALALFAMHATESVASSLLMLWALLMGISGARTEAITGSFIAALCLDYLFIPPIFKITVDAPSGWISLFVFLAASLLASNLSSLLRRQRDELAERQTESERLHALSRAMLLSDRQEDMRRLLVNKSMELFGLEEAVLFESANGEFWRSSAGGAIKLDDLRRVATYGSEFSDQNGVHFIPVCLGNKTYGSLGYRGTKLSRSTASALSSTLGTGLAQAQAHEASSQAEAVRRSEELKSMMIDALAHDLKTPLTAIEMAADTLIHTRALPKEETATLLQEIRQAAQGLRQLVHGAIHLARVDGKRLRLEARAIPVSEVISAALRSVADRGSHTITVDVQPGIPLVLADDELLVQALKQLLDNAVKYSPSKSAVNICATCADNLISISVRDAGPGLTELEQGRVFEKFYRGRHESSAIQGTGMGLAIAKEIAEAHSGALSVESQVGQGTRFTITLKAAIMDQTA